VAERKHTRVLLGTLEVRAERYGDSEKVLHSALALRPADAGEDAAALFHLGEAYAGDGKAESAREAWTKAASTEPDGPLATKAREELAKLPR
jgi:Flp pilus assembly protein TadD